MLRPKILINLKKLIPWESSCFSICPEFFMVWLIYSDEELLAVNRTFSGRRFAGCLPIFRIEQGGVLEKQEASAEEAVSILYCLPPLLALCVLNHACTRLIILTSGKNNHKIKIAESGQLAVGIRHQPLIALTPCMGREGCVKRCMIKIFQVGQGW